MEQCHLCTNRCANTFPDKYLIVPSIVQDVAVVLGQQVLFEWVFISHQRCLHGAGSIRNLHGEETKQLKSLTEPRKIIFLSISTITDTLQIHEACTKHVSPIEGALSEGTCLSPSWEPTRVGSED